MATVAPTHNVDKVVPDKEDSGEPPLPQTTKSVIPTIRVNVTHIYNYGSNPSLAVQTQIA